MGACRGSAGILTVVFPTHLNPAVVYDPSEILQTAISHGSTEAKKWS